MLPSVAYMLGALVLTVLVHGYLHRRLIHDTDLAAAWRRRARIALGIATMLFPAGMAGLLLMRDLPRAVRAPFMWCAFGWVGLLAFLLPLLFLAEPVRLWRPPNASRRRAIAMLSGMATLALGGTAAITAQLAPLVRRLRIPLPGLRTGCTLVQLSDLHVSATIGRALVESLVATVNALEPDVIAITGDLVDGSVKDLGPLVASLAELRAKHGVFFVTGNHEYLSGAEEWLDFLPSLGIRALRNEHASLGEIDLVGIDDPSGASWLPGHGSDLAAALRDRDRSRPSILLAHRPDDIGEAARAGIDLQISGHTHGGQLSPIGWALERARQPYVYGLHEVGKTLLYVTSGAGYWGPPMRLGTRAEIVVFELVPV